MCSGWLCLWPEVRRANHNGDGAISRAEFFNQDAVDDDRGDSFPSLDANRDGRTSRDEWHGTASLFTRLDANHDGFISRTEMPGTAAPPDLFTSLDMNRDRVITPNEWDLEGQMELDQADSGYNPSIGPRADYQTGYREAFRRAYREGWDQAK